MFIFSVILSLSILIVVLLNRSYFVADFINSDSSLLNSGNCSSRVSLADHKAFYLLGLFISKFFDERFIEEQEQKAIRLELSATLIVNNIGLAFSFLVFFILFGFYLQNIIYLVFAFILAVYFLFEIEFLYQDHIKELEAGASHLLKCLRILLVKSNLPIALSIDTIADTLPPRYKAIKRELANLTKKIEQVGVNETLALWQVNGEKFKSLISVLESANHGAANKSLQDNLEALINDIDEEERFELEEQSNNLQLYLIVPVIISLMLTMVPMYMAINFSMQKVGMF